MWKQDFSFLPIGVDSDSDQSDSDTSMDPEKLMKEIQRLYTVKEVGLRDTAKHLKLDNISCPRQKITVLLVGSHNSAKEKFLDLYFNEPRQEGYVGKVDYDKLDRIYITHGNRRKMLRGEAVLDYCPHLAELRKVPGLQDYLTTEIATRQRKSLVSFILAPERVSGKHYLGLCDSACVVDENNNPIKNPVCPFALETALKTLVEAADLIFIFFDPTGVVSPVETLNPFKDFWDEHHDKFHLLLAKASEQECSEQVREDSLVGIVHALWRYPAIRKTGILPNIYCPDLTLESSELDEQLWTVIQKTAEKSVDTSLARLENDAKLIQQYLQLQLDNNTKAKERSKSTSSGSTWKCVIAILLLLVLLLHLNRYVCKQQERWNEVCETALGNRAFWGLVGGIMMIFLIPPSAFGKDMEVLSEEKEELLNRRIRFVNHALYHWEKLRELHASGRM